MRESIIKKQILLYLQCLENQGKGYFVSTQTGSFPIARRDGSHGWMRTGKKGCPDITGCFRFLVKDLSGQGMEYWQEKYVAIEVKSDIGKQTIQQKETEEKIKKLGGMYLLARDISDLIKIGIQ